MPWFGSYLSFGATVQFGNCTSIESDSGYMLIKSDTMADLTYFKTVVSVSLTFINFRMVCFASGIIIERLAAVQCSTEL